MHGDCHSVKSMVHQVQHYRALANIERRQVERNPFVSSGCETERPCGSGEDHCTPIKCTLQYCTVATGLCSRFTHAIIRRRYRVVVVRRVLLCTTWCEVEEKKRRDGELQLYVANVAWR